MWTCAGVRVGGGGSLRFVFVCFFIRLIALYVDLLGFCFRRPFWSTIDFVHWVQFSDFVSQPGWGGVAGWLLRTPAVRWFLSVHVLPVPLFVSLWPMVCPGTDARPRLFLAQVVCYAGADKFVFYWRPLWDQRRLKRGRVLSCFFGGRRWLGPVRRRRLVAVLFSRPLPGW